MSSTSHTFADLLKQYEKRLLGRSEWANAAVGSIRAEEIDECMALLSPDLRDLLKSQVKSLPTTDAGWSEFKVLTPGMLSKPADCSEEDWKAELKRRMDALKIKMQQGAKALCDYFHKLEASC